MTSQYIVTKLEDCRGVKDAEFYKFITEKDEVKNESAGIFTLQLISAASHILTGVCLEIREAKKVK